VGRRPWVVVTVVLVLLAALVVVLGMLLTGPRSSTPSPAAAPAEAGNCKIVSADVPGAGSGLPVRPLCALPAEAATVVAVIRRGGPFPRQQDGATFRNAERLLPLRPAGYYREYTVPTPGEVDRGARRLVTGGGGEFYYTADHYTSFVVVDVEAVAASTLRGR
jgi:ribonuclease T1